MIFLPANTTSVLQPLDQGIIAMVKGRYRKRLLQRVLTTMDNGEDVSKMNKCVQLSDACSWIASSVKEVPASSVRKCFARCGFTPDVLTLDEDDVPLAQLVDRENELTLAQLAESARTQLGLNDVIATAEELVAFDVETPTCAPSSGSVEADIIAAHQPSTPADSEELTVSDDDDEEEAAEASGPPPPTSRQMLESLRAIMEHGGVTSEIRDLVSQAERLMTEDVLRGKMSATRQLTITAMFGQRQ